MFRPLVGTAEAREHPSILTRRKLLWDILLWTGWGFIASILLVLVGGIVRFMYPKVSYEASKVFKAGRPENYKVGSVNLIPGRGVWVVRGEEGFYALLAKCTHLGCQPVWYGDQQVFKCPCHGSRFYKDGVNFAGPAPRPLERLFIDLSKEGYLVVDKGKTVGMDYLLKI